MAPVSAPHSGHLAETLEAEFCQLNIEDYAMPSHEER